MPQPRLHASHAARQAAYHRRQKEAMRRQMQDKGLPALPAIPTMPGTTRWRKAIERADALLEIVEDEMEGYAADRSDQWQEGDRAQDFQDRLDAVREARTAVAALRDD